MTTISRLFLTAAVLLGIGPLHAADTHSNGAKERAYWVQSLTKIADPVLTSQQYAP